MMSINLPEHQIREYLVRNDLLSIMNSIHIACVNSPINCTLSGSKASLDLLKAQLDDDKVFAQVLNTGVAYHSPSMGRISSQYLDLIGSLQPSGRQEDFPMISSVSGQAVSSSSLTRPKYWVENLVSPVRFYDAMGSLIQQAREAKVGMNVAWNIVEIGPHGALRRPIRDIVESMTESQRRIHYTSVLTRSMCPVRSVLETVGTLFCYGHSVSISTANQTPGCRDGPTPFLVDCPAYPFNHANKYWAEPRLSRMFRLREDSGSQLLHSRFAHHPLEYKWRSFLSTESLPWTEDHVVSKSTRLLKTQFDNN